MKKILVIDDEELTLKLLSTLLEEAGYEVVCASDGEDGLQAYHDNSPDLVITDMIMPRKDGLETILALREIDEFLPVVAMSGGGAIAKERYLKVAGFFENIRTLAKPFTRDEILHLVDSLLP